MMHLRQTTGRTRATDVAVALRELIRGGVLQPGAKLPSEAQLTAEHGVGRSVVREALQQLQAAGLVESFQGRGSYVLAVPEPASGSIFGIVTPGDAVDLMEFRIGVESEAAGLAAERRSHVQLAAIERALDRFSRVNRHPTDVVNADFDLHLRIASASGNPFFRDVLAHIGPRMILVQRVVQQPGMEMTNPDHFTLVLGEHAQIVEAISIGDRSAATAAMRVHLSMSKARQYHR